MEGKTGSIGGQLNDPKKYQYLVKREFAHINVLSMDSRLLERQMEAGLCKTILNLRPEGFEDDPDWKAIPSANRLIALTEVMGKLSVLITSPSTNTSVDSDPLSVTVQLSVDSFEDTDTQLQYRLDGGEWVTVTPSISNGEATFLIDPFPSNTDTVIEVRLIHVNGASATDSVILWKRPNITILTPSDGDELTSLILFDIETDQPEASKYDYYYQVNGNGWNQIDASQITHIDNNSTEFSLVPPGILGEHTYEIKAVDEYGIESNIPSVQLLNVPIVTIQAPADQSSIDSRSYTLSGEVNHGGAGLNDIYYQISTDGGITWGDKIDLYAGKSTIDPSIDSFSESAYTNVANQSDFKIRVTAVSGSDVAGTDTHTVTLYVPTPSKPTNFSFLDHPAGSRGVETDFSWDDPVPDSDYEILTLTNLSDGGKTVTFGSETQSVGSPVNIIWSNTEYDSGGLVQPGLWQASLVAYNSIGMNSEAATLDYVWDETAPSITITSPTDGQTFTGSTSRSLEVTVSDNVEIQTVEYRLSGIDVTGTWTAMTDNGDGTYSATINLLEYTYSDIEVRATDTSGNSAVNEITVSHLDETPPVISFTNPTGGGTITVQSSSFSVEGTVTDNNTVSAVKYNINPGNDYSGDGSGWNIIALDSNDAFSISVSLSNEETKTIRLYAVDAHGNEVTGDVVLNHDVPAPNPATNIYADREKATGEFYLNWDTDASVESTDLTVQPSPNNTQNDFNKTYTNVGVEKQFIPDQETDAEGDTMGAYEYEFILTTYNSVGETATSVFTYTPPAPDLTGPTITFNSPIDGNSYTSQTQTVDVDISDSAGVDASTVEIRVNGSSNGTWQQMTDNGNGNFTKDVTLIEFSGSEIEVRAYDNAANPTTKAINVSHIDTIDPSFNITSPAGGGEITVQDSSYTIEGSVSDNNMVQFARYKINPGADYSGDGWNTLSPDSGGNFSLTISLSNEETKVVRLYAEDPHGNTVTTDIILNHDVPAPSAPTNIFVDREKVGGDFYLNWSNGGDTTEVDLEVIPGPTTTSNYNQYFTNVGTNGEKRFFIDGGEADDDGDPMEYKEYEFKVIAKNSVGETAVASILYTPSQA